MCRGKLPISNTDRVFPRNIPLNDPGINKKARHVAGWTQRRIIGIDPGFSEGHILGHLFVREMSRRCSKMLVRTVSLISTANDSVITIHVTESLQERFCSNAKIRKIVKAR